MAQVLSNKEQQKVNEESYNKQFTLPDEPVPDILHLEEAKRNPKYYNLNNKEKLTNQILFSKSRNW